MVRLPAIYFKSEAAVDQCKNCGMLTLLSNRNEEWICANKEFRETGEPRLSHLGGSPRCAANVIAFPDQKAFILEEMERDRSGCERFIRWEPSLSPKEHLQMFFQQVAYDLQKSRADLQADYIAWKKDQTERDERAARHREQAAADQAERDRRFEQQIQALQQVRHNESIGVGKSQATGANWQAIGAVASAIIAVAAIVISVLALLRG